MERRPAIMDNALKLQQVSLDRNHINKLFDLVKKDFGFLEHIPFFIIHRAMKKDILYGVYLTDGEVIYGYAIYQIEPSLNVMHVLYLAIRAEYRSLGLGGVLIERLQEHEKIGLILEVEDPDAVTDKKEATVRSRRISFYVRNGLALQPDLRLSHFGYPLLVMTNEQYPGLDWLHYSRLLYNRIYGISLANIVIKGQFPTKS